MMVRNFATVNMQGEEIRYIGERLRSERLRLGMTQPEFAVAASSSKRTVLAWEQGDSSPTALQLNRLHAAGVNVLFVVTGSLLTLDHAALAGDDSGQKDITEGESELVIGFRSLSDERKGLIGRLLRALSAEQDNEQQNSGKKCE